MSGDSCQAELHGCLPAENAAIYSQCCSGSDLVGAIFGSKPVARRYFSALPQPVLFPEKLNRRSVSRFCSGWSFACFACRGLPEDRFLLRIARLKEQNPWLA